MFLLNCSEQFNEQSEPQIRKKIRTAEADPKFTGSYKKKKVYSYYLPALSLSN